MSSVVTRRLLALATTVALFGAVPAIAQAKAMHSMKHHAMKHHAMKH